MLRRNANINMQRLPLIRPVPAHHEPFLEFCPCIIERSLHLPAHASYVYLTLTVSAASNE